MRKSRHILDGSAKPTETNNSIHIEQTAERLSALAFLPDRRCFDGVDISLEENKSQNAPRIIRYGVYFSVQTKSPGHHSGYSGTFDFLYRFSLKNFFRNGTTSRGLFQMTTFMYASSQNESPSGRLPRGNPYRCDPSMKSICIGRSVCAYFTVSITTAVPSTVTTAVPPGSTSLLTA